MQILALITLSILAGYGLSVEISTCTLSSGNVTTQFSTHYPFDLLTVQRTNLTSNQRLGDITIPGTPTMISAGRQASFFVAWGVLTLFYCIIAVVVYITTMAEAERLGKVYHVLCYTVSVCVCACVRVCVCVCTHMRVCECTCIDIYMYMCNFVFMCVHACSVC